MVQQLVSDKNKSKRQSLLMLRSLVGITEIVWQVTGYRKIFSSGYHHLILGGTTVLPANHATLGLEHGSFRETRFRNGKRLRRRAPVCGFMGDVR